MILVTGGNGFVGRTLIRELLKKSYKVSCLVRDPLRAGFIKDAGCVIVRGDVTKGDTVADAVGPDVDTVIHLVGILVETKGATYSEVHTEGTRNVVEACRKKGVRRYLHISALGTRPGARSRYHKTKYEAEEIIKGSGLEYTIFRPSVIFGREDKFTNMFAKVMRLSPLVLVPGRGQNKMQPVFVEDLARAMTESIVMEETKGKILEVAGPQVLTFDEIIDGIAAVLGRRIFKAHVPLKFYRLGAAIMEALLPRPPLSRDSLLMLEEDNITEYNALTEVFNIRPTSLTEGMKTYLH
ncbi:MAG: NAD(P)H-binding protein [Thermodesulfobacteriota bacterium]|nr:MAG: NAD(P)H-binding protein [Thermodesulfobacteriota bacterium]